MYSYFAFGLNIDSEIQLPELFPGVGEADVTIRLGNVDQSSAGEVNRGHHVTAEEIHFCYRDVGRFLVRGGREVLINPAPAAEPLLLRLFVLGTILAAVLHQRGLLVLHASAVMVDSGALVFLGHRGWGKSTLAATLQARDYRLVADDLVVVDFSDASKIQILPGFPQFKLWPDAVISLGIDPEALPRVHPLMSKRAYHIGPDFTVAPVPLKSIYVLDLDDSMEINSIEPREAFIELVRHTYLIRYLEGTGASPLHFRQCSTIANAIPIFHLKRPSALSLLPNVAEMLEDNLARMAT